MNRFVRPVLFGLLAFVAWVGTTYILSAGVLSAAPRETVENAGDILGLLLFVGSLVCSGAVAAWFAPLLWRESSAIVGLICTLILAWFGWRGGEAWASALLLLIGVGLSFAGGASVSFLLRWIKS